MNSDLRNDNQADLMVSAPSQESLRIEGFEILSVLGSGGMSTVFRATQTQMGRPVAVKVLHHHLANDAAQLSRFRQEARLSMLLVHPNIARVISFGVADHGRLYLVMELCEGQTLRQIISTENLNWSLTVAIFEQVCAALSHAHKQGVVHRDLKPANVFITKDSVGNLLVKLIDFGIARLINPSFGDGQKLTATGVVIGSPHYMSPEQCVGARADARCDIYALGCMFYHVIAGAPPFSGESAFELAQKHVHEAPRSLSEACNEDISPAVEQLVDRALAKEPSQRFQSADEFSQALSNIGGGAIRKNRRGFAHRLQFRAAHWLGLGALSMVLLVVAYFTVATGKRMTHSALFENAEKLLDSGHYEEALPKLLAARNTVLNDDEAGRLIDDLCDLSSILKRDGRSADEVHTFGVEPHILLADAAIEPTANRPPKFAVCKAIINRGEIRGGHAIEHMESTLDLSGLTARETNYCQGRVEFTKAYSCQGAGRNGAAAKHYDLAIQHLELAEYPADFARVLMEHGNFLSDGLHAEQARQCVQRILNLVPLVQRGHDRQSARSLVDAVGVYMLGDPAKDKEARAAIARAGEIYRGKAGGHSDLTSYYRIQAALAARREDYQAENAWLGQALAEQKKMTSHPDILVDVTCEMARNRFALKQPARAILLLQEALPTIDRIASKISRLNHRAATLTLLVSYLETAGRFTEANHYKTQLVACLQERGQTGLH